MNAETQHSSLPLYAQIAQRMAHLIDSRAFKPGQRLPSVRDLAATNGVSISTAVQALRWLEERKLVAAKPKAGYFVAPAGKAPALPAVSRPPRHSLLVERQSRAELIFTVTDTTHAVSFGGACPKDPTFFDEARVRTAIQRATRVQDQREVEFAGQFELAREERALCLGVGIVVKAPGTVAIGGGRGGVDERQAGDGAKFQ